MFRRFLCLVSTLLAVLAVTVATTSTAAATTEIACQGNSSETALETTSGGERCFIGTEDMSNASVFSPINTLSSGQNSGYYSFGEGCDQYSDFSPYQFYGLGGRFVCWIYVNYYVFKAHGDARRPL